MKLSTIDIGSNASRLLIAEVKENAQKELHINKLNLVRVPLRLGFDVFENKEISKPKTEMLIQTMKAYQHLLNAYDVNHLKACATSAMRDAINKDDVIRKVKLETGIEIEIINGNQEAKYIFDSHVADTLTKEHTYLYIDVGGGSTELTWFLNGQLHHNESFNIGTIRLLKRQVSEQQWTHMRNQIRIQIKDATSPVAIGSGGNINKIFSLSKKKEGKPLSISLLKKYYHEFSLLSLDERIEMYKLKEDRADVVVPALLIFINVMRWADINEIYVPKIGLVDGLVRSLWAEVVSNKGVRG